MAPFKTILAASDLSASADNAAHRAALLARRHGAELHVVHVVNPGGLGRVRDWLAQPIDVKSRVDAARERLERLATELSHRHGVTARAVVHVGDTIEQLHGLLATADLLVMGQRRRSTLSEWVLGRTAQRLIEKSRRPVLVVKRAADAGYRKVLVPVDLTPGSNSAAVAAAAFAPGAALQIFHAFGSSGEVSMPVANVREHVVREGLARAEAGVLARMRRGIARLGLDPRGMVFSIGRGSPIGATLDKAKALRADLIVASKQRRSRNATAILGSVNGLLARSRCDMLIVPGGVPDACHAGTVMPPPARTAAGGGWQTAHRPARTGPSWPESWHAPSPGAASSAGRDAMRLAAR